MAPAGALEDPIAVPYVQRRRWPSIFGGALVVVVLLGPALYLLARGLLDRQVAIGISIAGFILAVAIVWGIGRFTRHDRAEL